MRAREFIAEDIRDKKGNISSEHSAPFSNTSTLPGQNMNHGNAYLHSLFLKALAGAGAGDTPSVNMGEKNWASGDPIISPYHPIEEEMIDNASRHVGDKGRKKWGNSRSEEPENVHKISPVKGFKGYPR